MTSHFWNLTVEKNLTKRIKILLTQLHWRKPKNNTTWCHLVKNATTQDKLLYKNLSLLQPILHTSQLYNQYVHQQALNQQALKHQCKASCSDMCRPPHCFQHSNDRDISRRKAEQKKSSAISSKEMSKEMRGVQ